MKNNSSSSFVKKVSGAVSDALSDVLDRQSPSLAVTRQYQERFLSNNRILSNRRVYISEEMYQLLTRVVAAVGKEHTSVGNYVTEIVREHVERHRDSINSVYLTNTHPLF